MNSKRTVLINGDKIEIEFEYNMEIIQVVRNIAGREWNKPAHPKVWTLPITPWHMAQVVKLLSPFEFWIDPKIIQGANHEDKMPELSLPDELYDYQKLGVRFICSTNGRCIIADDMGLGKTAQALVFVDQFCSRTLIVTPSSVVLKWVRKECPMWAKNKKVSVVLNGKQPIDRDADILLMSYGIMVSRFAELSQIPFNCIVFDESHYIKSPKAQRSRVARSLVKSGVPRVLFLSGTPFMNRPSELFTALNMLDPKSYSNFYHYAARYCGWQYMGGVWVRPDRDVVTNASELAERLSDVMLRRTKKDVALELPDLSRSFVPVTIPNMAEYRQAKKSLRDWLRSREKEVKDPGHILTRLNVLRQIMGQGKVKAAIELAEDVLESNHQVVLFAHHKEVVQGLIDGLKQYGLGVIDGSTPVKERQRLIDTFANQSLTSNHQMRVMIITVAGAEGIDLYSASYIIFVEREWTPAREEQAEARLHRIGQKNPVSSYYLVATGTVDEKLNEVIEGKRAMFKSVIRQDEIISRILEALDE